MNTIFSVFVFLGLSLGSVQVFADHHDHGKGPMPEPSKEERVKMADMYGKMADCLRSDKSMKICHDEMTASCPMMKDGKACPMGMDHHHMDETPKAKK